MLMLTSGMWKVKVVVAVALALPGALALALAMVPPVPVPVSVPVPVGSTDQAMTGATRPHDPAPPAPTPPHHTQLQLPRPPAHPAQPPPPSPARASSAAPRFSWDTVPLYWYSTDPFHALDNDTVAYAASFPVVVPNGNNRQYLAPSGTDEENKLVATARQLKAHDSTAAVFFYLNTMMDWHQFNLHVRRLCPLIFPTSLPHFRLYEVVALHMCVLPYKYRKILEMLLTLMK